MTTDAAQPRLSATVLIVRDAKVLEVLMVARHYEIDFASGALVFPGGKANAEDEASGWDEWADGHFEGVERAARICAVREAFEESGLLLARDVTARGEGEALIGPDMANRLAQYRGAVDRGEQSFLELMREYGLVLALDTLIHFGHWITPEMMPKRFDTHFYLAAAPMSQIASHDGRETTDAVWLNPADALAQAANDQATIIFPTRMNLEKLKHAASLSQAINMFVGAPVVTVEPQLGTSDDGEPCLFIPEEAGYGCTMELLKSVMN